MLGKDKCPYIDGPRSYIHTQHFLLQNSFSKVPLNRIMQHKSGTDEPCERPCSEFEDLINKICELEEKAKGCLKEIGSLYQRFMDANPGTAERSDAGQRVWNIAADMEGRYQQIDTHYGWVLASDHALVNKVLSSYFGEETDGKVWLRRAIRKLKNIRLSLEMSQQRVFHQYINTSRRHMT
jgi:hypothetical protein